MEMSLSAMLHSRSAGQAGALLHGSDVPAGTKSFTIELAAIREAPEGFSAVGIIDFKKPVYGKSAWAVNKTNMAKLIKLFGEDEQNLVGKKIKLEVTSARNPQSGLAVSLRQ